MGEAIAGVVMGLTKHAWSAQSGLTAALGLSLAFSLWWVNFNNIDGAAIRSSASFRNSGMLHRPFPSYIIFMTKTTLEALPHELRLADLSLGFTPWQNLVHILLPAAGQGILSGMILAVGRAAEDTAVILLAGVVANAGLPLGLLDKYEALPFHIRCKVRPTHPKSRGGS